MLPIEVVEESYEVVDVVFMTLHIEEEQPGIYEVEPRDGGDGWLCLSSPGQFLVISHDPCQSDMPSPVRTLISFSQTAPSTALDVNM